MKCGGTTESSPADTVKQGNDWCLMQILIELFQYCETVCRDAAQA